MKSWALSVGAVLLFISSINLILPEGKTSKIIKPIFTILLILVVIKPISGLKNFDLSFDGKIDSSIKIQSDFIEYVSAQKVENYKKNCVNIINELGVENCNIDINYNETFSLNTHNTSFRIR